MPSEQAPPRIPIEDELQEAQGLCTRAFRHGPLRLTMLEREAITRLCGRMPESKTQAQRWRIYLRGLRREVATDDCEC